VFESFKSYIIFFMIVVIMILSLWLHGLSASILNLSQYQTFSSPDVWYNFRLAELMVHNFPTYIWFDPMTAYPVGKSLDWGPLLPFIGSGIALLTGATTRDGMMYVVSWIGPIFAALLVPVMYYTGKLLRDWKTGLLAAGLITILSPLFFVNTSFGYFDHHGMETFFSTLFCLMYIFTVINYRKKLPEFNISKSSIYLLSLSIMTGLIYFIGYLNIPTIILFGLIVTVYTFFQVIWDTIYNKPTRYLLFTNIGVFIPVIVLMFLFGIKQPGLSLQQYTLGQIFAITAVVIETILLYILSKYLGSDKKLFLASVVALIVVGAGITWLLLNNVFISMLFSFFGQSVETTIISEAGPWSFSAAFSSFNFGIILAVIGFIIVLYHLYCKKSEEYLFFTIWSLIIFFSTLQHLRYEYYFVVNVALLSSLCIIEGFDVGQSYLVENIENLRKIHKKNSDTSDTKTTHASQKKFKPARIRNVKQVRESHKSIKNAILGGVILASIVLLAFLLIITSIQNDIHYSTSSDQLINKNWLDALEWLPLHTPDPGISYLGLYTRENFTYPNQSYGILTWWDYGHYITYISNRIPNTNPFQDNLKGPSGVAAFFLTNSESNATRILDSLGTRYVITDTSLTTIKFADITNWYDSKLGFSPYMLLLYMNNPKQPGQWIQLKGKLEPYYCTTVVRLQNFDGSMIIPEKTVYSEYYIQNQGGMAIPIVTKFDLRDQADTINAVKQFNSQPLNGHTAIEVGQYLDPVKKIPALSHFRLIYESPGNSSSLKFTDSSDIGSINYVKVFEYVPGARIKGDGVIELQIITNTGRKFTYAEESTNGEFIVPYSTIGNQYDVKAIGKYHINGTNREFDVNEEDVINVTEVKP
jgi:dolichyl-phosphooligosaccharide-protein glycotransferase